MKQRFPSLLGQPVYAHRRLRGSRYRGSLGYSNHRGLLLLDKHLATAFQCAPPISILTSCCRHSDDCTGEGTIALIIESIHDRNDNKIVKFLRKYAKGFEFIIFLFK